MLSFEKSESLLHKLLVILENAPVSGVVIEHELGIRKTARQVDRIAAGHHLVVIAIRHQHRMANARQIGRSLTPPGMYGLQLSNEGGDRNRLIAVVGALFQPFQKLARRPAAIGGFGKEEIVFRITSVRDPSSDDLGRSLRYKG